MIIIVKENIQVGGGYTVITNGLFRKNAREKKHNSF